MNVALIKHAQNDINRNKRRENQNWLVAQRGLESSGRSLEACIDAERHSHPLLNPINHLDRVSQRTSRRQVKRNSGNRELPEVIHSQRRVALRHLHERAEWYLRSSR